MKTTPSALKRYWRELILLIVVFVVCFAIPFLEVRNMRLTFVVVLIIAVYLMATWACKPRYGEKNEKE